MPTQKQVTVFKFKELSDKAQETALSKLYDINVDGDYWHDYLDMEFKEELKKIGIEADKFFWELDYNNRFFCLDKHAEIFDIELFLKYCKVDLRTKRAKDIINEYGLQIQTKYFAGSRTENYITANSYDEQDDLTECLQDKFNHFLKQLSEAYDYATSKEQIIETIEANDYEFRETGELFY